MSYSYNQPIDNFSNKIKTAPKNVRLSMKFCTSAIIMIRVLQLKTLVLIFMFNHLTYVPNCIQCIMVYRQVYQLQVQVLSKNKPNEPISTVSTWKFNVICFQAARLESTLEASFFRQYVFLYIKKLSHIFIEVVMLFKKMKQMLGVLLSFYQDQGRLCPFQDR